MKIFAVVDDHIYRELLQSCFDSIEEQFNFQFFESVSHLESEFRSAQSQVDFVIIDAFEDAEQFLNRFPEQVTFLISPKYSAELEQQAKNLGAAGYFPCIPDAEVVAYLAEQIQQSSFVEVLIH